MAKARLRRGIEMVKLANRIEALKMSEEDDTGDMPATGQGAAEAQASAGAESARPLTGARRLSKAARSAIFREVVLAKVREMKAEEEKEKAQRTMSERKQAPQ